MEFNNGDLYSGDWKFGKFDGIGKLTHQNKDYYEGSFKQGLKSGRGVLVL
jgi:hypothetical protein